LCDINQIIGIYGVDFTELRWFVGYGVDFTELRFFRGYWIMESSIASARFAGELLLPI
jgi:hypothetical protein